MKMKALVISLLCVLVAIVSLQNAQEVKLNFLVWDFSISRILLILITFVLGLAVGVLVSMKRPGKKPATVDVEQEVVKPVAKVEGEGDGIE